jgi:hypothetical protein
VTVTHVILSAAGGGEYSACGFAFDAFASHGKRGAEAAEGNFEWARPGLRVTCPECCRIVREIRESLRGLKLVAAKSN